MRSGAARIVILLLLVTAAAALPIGARESGQKELPTKEEILSRYIEAVGGREAIEKLSTRVCRIEQIHDLNWTDPKVQKVQMETYAKDPHMILWKEHTSEGVHAEGYDGKHFWHSEGDERVLREEPTSIKHRFVFDPRGSLDVEYYFPNLTVESIETANGRECYKLQPEGLKEAHFSLFFDAETGLLARIGYYWDIEDYREIDGVMVPFKIVMSRKGGSTTLTFESIEHNVPLTDDIFTATTEGDK